MDDTGSNTRLGNSRLVLVLDALLETGSATKAGQRLGLQTSQISRLLGQLRQKLNDPLFTRSGRGLVPTSYAESLRPMVRALTTDMDTIFDKGRSADPAPSLDDRWNVPYREAIPGLAVRSAGLLDGEPSVKELAGKFACIDGEATAHERLRKYCASISKGAGHRRSLTLEEARDAMTVILAGNADPIQIGALFGIIQHRGVTPTELAGFTQAIRAHIVSSIGNRMMVDLDWPCYTSPHNQSAPWFFHAARLTALAGYRVLLHGGTGTGSASARHEVVIHHAGLPVCKKASEIAEALTSHRIAYVPLPSLSAQIYRLFGLHGLLGARSPVHAAMSLANPAGARVSLLGVSNPSEKELQRDTAGVLGINDLTILGSVRDIAQFNPFRSTIIHRIAGGKKIDIMVRSIREPKSEPYPQSTTLEFWQGVWSGSVIDRRAEKIILATTASALLALSEDPDSSFDHMLETAATLWKSRFELSVSAPRREPKSI